MYDEIVSIARKSFYMHYMVGNWNQYHSICTKTNASMRLHFWVLMECSVAIESGIINNVTYFVLLPRAKQYSCYSWKNGIGTELICIYLLFLKFLYFLMG